LQIYLKFEIKIDTNSANSCCFWRFEPFNF